MRGYLSYTFLGVIFLLGCALQAQPDKLFFHHLNQNDGLIEQNNVNIFTDSRHLTWISSVSGLNCYNGVTVKNYTPDADDFCSLKGHNITSPFFEDDSTNIWFSTYEGLHCWNRKEDCFHYYPLKDTMGNIINADNYLVARDEANNFWILSRFAGNMIYKFNPFTHAQEKVSTVSSEKCFAAMDGKKLRYIFSLSGNNHLQVLNIHKSAVISKSELNLAECGSGFNIKEIFDAYYVAEDSICFATDAGLFMLNLNNNKNSYLFQLPFSGKKRPKVTSVTSITSDHLLIATDLEGLFLFDVSDKKLTSHYAADKNNNDLINNDIRHTYYDNNGTIWVSYDEAGVSYANIFKTKFETILDKKQLFSGMEGIAITQLFQDRNNKIWVGTKNEGIYSISPTSEVRHYLNHELMAGGRQDVFNFFEDQEGILWTIWGNYNLNYFDPLKDQWISLSQQKEHIFNNALSAITAKNGDLILGNYEGGLFVMKKRNLIYNPNQMDTIQRSKPYTYLFQSKKGLIYACRNWEAVETYEYVKGQWKLKDVLNIKGIVNYIYESEKYKKIFIATSFGLVILDEKDNKFKTYNKNNGLPNQEVQAILEDDKGIWVSTRRGLAQYFPEKESFRTYSLADGLQSLEFLPAACKLKNGRFVFGGANGINAFYPADIKDLVTLPFINITGISVNDTTWKSAKCLMTGARNFDAFKKIRLRYSENTIAFDFVCVDYADPANNRVAYRLEGYDNGWDTLSAPGGRARYAQLHEGTYTFQVIGANSDGVWNPEPRTIEVEILPPFYRTWWFYLLEALVIAGMIGGGVKIYVDNQLRAERTKQDKLLALQKERDRIASEMHDDVGAGLTAIRLMSDRIQRQVQDNKLSLQINRITVQAGDLVENMSSIIWAMNSSNDTYEGLFLYMRRYAIEYLTETHDLNASFPMTDTYPPLPISGERRRQIFLAFKESLHNIVKHAGAETVAIQVSFDTDKMTIRVADDGKGIPADRKNGNGLVNMGKRMQVIGGQFSFRDNTPQGTILLFEIPLLL